MKLKDMRKQLNGIKPEIEFSDGYHSEMIAEMRKQVKLIKEGVDAIKDVIRVG